jgi:hypothetical protein
MMSMFMKRPVSILLVFFACIFTAVAQKISGPFVMKPVYSDLSPPLISLTRPASGKKDSHKVERAEQEIWNYFRKNLKSSHYKDSSDDPLRQKCFGKIKSDTTLQNFEGTPNVNTAIPPDTYGDVGMDYYFHMVNLSFTIFDKSGNILYGPTYAGNIWNGLPYSSNSGDGIVLYDDQAGRWLIEAGCLPSFPLPPYFIMIAVSQTSDPTGSWYRWEYQFQDIPDYPKLGIWRDSYFLTINQYNTPTSFIGVGAVAFDRSAMLAGDPSPTMVMFNLDQDWSIYSLLPADCDGAFPPAGLPGYFAYLGSDFLGIYEFHTDWTNPSSSTFGNPVTINVGAYSPNIKGIPQKGSSVYLDPIPDRLMCRLEFRKFPDHQSMVVNHTVRLGDYWSGIRWYELRRTFGDWSLYQQSTYAPDSNSRWMGSIAMDSAGNIALGYSVSGPNMYPSVRFTGRMHNDPPGQMTIAEQSIIEGGGAQTHPASTYARWGDYSSMTVDPADPSLFWYTQEYYPVTADYEWHTRIAAFTFKDILDIKAVAESSVICNGQSDPLDVEVSGGNGTNTYSWTSIPAGFTSTLKNPVVTPESQTIYIVNVSSGNQSRNDTIMVDVTPIPSAFAGNDTMCCRHIDGIPLTGSAETYISVKWVTSGDGTFADPYALYTTYTPGTKDRSDSLIDLKLIVYPQPPCPELSAHKMVRMVTCTGIPIISPGSNSLSIYPNPTQGKFTISLPQDALVLEVSDLQGKIILREELSSHTEKELKLDLSDKSRGLYPVKIILEGHILRGNVILE